LLPCWLSLFPHVVRKKLRLRHLPLLRLPLLHLLLPPQPRLTRPSLLKLLHLLLPPQPLRPPLHLLLRLLPRRSNLGIA
jgi:hypothetical protein